MNSQYTVRLSSKDSVICIFNNNNNENTMIYKSEFQEFIPNNSSVEENLISQDEAKNVIIDYHRGDNNITRKKMLQCCAVFFCYNRKFITNKPDNYTRFIRGSAVKNSEYVNFNSDSNYCNADFKQSQ